VARVLSGVASAGGLYRIHLVARNGAGETDGVLTIRASEPLSQTIAFDALTDRYLGDPPFTLSASASSGLPVSFEVVSGPATISGKSVTLAEPGTVTIRASQAGGNGWAAATPVERSFEVRLFKPTITAHPQATNVLIGSDLVLSVGATGTGPLSYQWRKGDADIPGETNSSLRLPSVQLPDGGLYAVTVTTAAGSITSEPALLRVLTVPVFTSDAVVRDENGSLLLSVKVTPGSRVVIEASSDLDRWEPLLTLTAVDDLLRVADASAKALPRRFYRARLLLE
jgi:hypothetical protein